MRKTHTVLFRFFLLISLSTALTMSEEMPPADQNNHYVTASVAAAAPPAVIWTNATILSTGSMDAASASSSISTNSSSSSASVGESPRVPLSPEDVILFQNPVKEIQKEPFRQQPKLRLLNPALTADGSAANGSSTLPSTSSYLVTATLKKLPPAPPVGGETTARWSRRSSRRPRPRRQAEAQARLLGRTTVEFVDAWANFTDLAVEQNGNGFVLEFVVFLWQQIPQLPAAAAGSAAESGEDSGASSRQLNLNSTPFDVFEFPLQVFVSNVVVVPVREKMFRVSISLLLWDFMREAPAQVDVINGTEWRYAICLHHNGSPAEALEGEMRGTFPPAKNRTGVLIFNLTSIGYRYQLNITVDSPDFKTRISNITAPFDALIPFSDRVRNLKTSSVTLTFNGSADDIQGEEDTFLTTFLNNFGKRYSDVIWQNSSIKDKDESVAVSVTLIGRGEDIQKANLALLEDSRKHYPMSFGTTMFVLQDRMEVDGGPYRGNDPIVEPDMTIYGFNLPTVFTIILMSFLCASFVIGVFVWRVREKKVMESYNRRMRLTRKRQNGHVNTAFDSNESVQTRNQVYQIAMNERAPKERMRGGCSEAESLRRCSSGGLPRYPTRHYRRMNAKFGSDDEDDVAFGGCAQGGIPLDDDIVFADTSDHELFSPGVERHHSVFASTSSSFHDDYYMRDMPGPSHRPPPLSYHYHNHYQPPQPPPAPQHHPTPPPLHLQQQRQHHHSSGRRKCSVTASTPSGSMASLPNSRSMPKHMCNTTFDSNYSLRRLPPTWSSHDEKRRMCNGRAPNANAIC